MNVSVTYPAIASYDHCSISTLHWTYIQHLQNIAIVLCKNEIMIR